ncbi:hypothetical protein [Limisalsivibrio acetivorans]|uniref:hypothetical protein n=1 Tax=Limisalsivibrio acetivorans TaxID=1304888 RepID=UPI0003B721C5|nr:hypothetical protein [Limisalsivibrio acetivorans]
MSRLVLLFALLLASINVYAADPQSIVDIQALANKLEQREMELNQRAAKLDEKEKRLRALEEELLNKENELNKIKQTVTSRLEDIKKVEDENLDTLAKVYASTKAKSAAAIISNMELDKSVQLMIRIQPLFAGKIMSELGKQAPQYASKLSERLAPEKLQLIDSQEQ